MSDQISSDSAEVARYALDLAMRVSDPDDLRLLFSALATTVSENPGLAPMEYVRAIETIAGRRGFFGH